MHELSSRCNYIRIKVPLILLTRIVVIYLVLPTLFNHLLTLLLLFNIFCCAEPTRSLLILLRSWCDSIDREIHHFLRLDNVHNLISVCIDIFEYLLLTLRLRTSILGVRAGVNNAIQVEVKIIDDWCARRNFVLQTLLFLPDTIPSRSDAQSLLFLLFYVNLARI